MSDNESEEMQSVSAKGVVELRKSDTEYELEVDDKYLVHIHVTGDFFGVSGGTRPIYYGSVFVGRLHVSSSPNMSSYAREQEARQKEYLRIYELPGAQETIGVWWYDRVCPEYEAVRKVQEFYLGGEPWINPNTEVTAEEWQEQGGSEQGKDEQEEAEEADKKEEERSDD